MCLKWIKWLFVKVKNSTRSVSICTRQEDVSCWHKQMDVSNEELLPKLYTNIIIFQVCSMAYKCTLRSTCIHATKLA